MSITVFDISSRKATDYKERHLKITKEVGDKAREGIAYCNHHKGYHRLGDFQKAFQDAIAYHERDLLKYCQKKWETRKEKEQRTLILTLSIPVLDISSRKIQSRIFPVVKITKEVGDKAGEGIAYCNLCNGYHRLGDFQKAFHYYRHFTTAEEGIAYGNLGNAYHSLEDFQEAFDYHKRYLQIGNKAGDKAREGIAYCNLGNAHQSCRFPEGHGLP